MKSKKDKSGFIEGALFSVGVFAVLLGIGLFIPGLRPLAEQLGLGLCLGFLALGAGVVVYAAWRIITFPSRSRKAAVRAPAAAGVR